MHKKITKASITSVCHLKKKLENVTLSLPNYIKNLKTTTEP